MAADLKDNKEKLITFCFISFFNNLVSKFIMGKIPQRLKIAKTFFVAMYFKDFC